MLTSTCAIIGLCSLYFMRSFSKKDTGNNCISQSTPVFWINLDQGSNRRRYMEHHMKSFNLRNFRIRASMPTDLYIPSDIFHANKASNCVMESKTRSFLKTRNASRIQTLFPNTRIYITGLCDILVGGNLKERLKFYSLTISHLTAINTAIKIMYSPVENEQYFALHPYAVIAEDDIRFLFRINFTALIESAPKDFAILQLTTSNVKVVKENWKAYISSNFTKLWTLRDQTYMWSTGSYLINGSAIQPTIAHIVREANAGGLEMRLIAGTDKPNCSPPECCSQITGRFNKSQPACILAKKGLTSDHFIYALGKTYLLTIPVLSAATVSNSSTLKQGRVSDYNVAFNVIEEYAHLMDDGLVPMPSFVSPLRSSPRC